MAVHVATTVFYDKCYFYRAMHCSAKHGIAIACRLSVCDVGGSGASTFEILETNCTVN